MERKHPSSLYFSGKQFSKDDEGITRKISLQFLPDCNTENNKMEATLSNGNITISGFNNTDIVIPLSEKDTAVFKEDGVFEQTISSHLVEEGYIPEFEVLFSTTFQKGSGVTIPDKKTNAFFKLLAGEQDIDNTTFFQDNKAGIHFMATKIDEEKGQATFEYETIGYSGMHDTPYSTTKEKVMSFEYFNKTIKSGIPHVGEGYYTRKLKSNLIVGNLDGELCLFTPDLKEKTAISSVSLELKEELLKLYYVEKEGKNLNVVSGLFYNLQSKKDKETTIEDVLKTKNTETLPLRFYDGIEDFDVKSTLRRETLNILDEKGEFLPSVDEDALLGLHKSIAYGEYQLKKGDMGDFIYKIVNQCMDKLVPLAETLKEHLNTKKIDAIAHEEQPRKKKSSAKIKP